jgi:hypothetical protein
MANAGVRGRPIAPLVLSAQERAYLERQVRRQRVARSLSERCRVTGIVGKRRVHARRTRQHRVKAAQTLCKRPSGSDLSGAG